MLNADSSHDCFSVTVYHTLKGIIKAKYLIDATEKAGYTGKVEEM